MDVNPASSPDGCPLVTVGIPTFNRPAGLQRTLDCIRNQTYQNLEILISDNSSTTAETRAVALAHEQADPRVRYHRQTQNIGLEANFKFLLAQARGEFFFWAADDDEWTPDFVAVCLKQIGQSGSVMTGMRNAVRTRGLLRWKPPLDISARHSAFADAVAFFNNLQPSLFYGMHRTESLRRVLGERWYDYYDCFMILRQILTVGFETAAPVCFHVGVDYEGPTNKPARPRKGAIYEYWPFLRDSLRATLATNKLSWWQKLRLGYLLTYVATNEFSFFEAKARPFQTRIVSAMKWLLRRVRPFLGVPLPPPPPTMVLPSDPAELCTMFIPHARLEDRQLLTADIADTQQQLRAKLEVIEQLENALNLRSRPHQSAFTLQLHQPAGPDPCAELLLSVAPEETMQALRHRLGALLLQLEAKEARIQELVRVRDRRARAA